jgi:hypothetical protein
MHSSSGSDKRGNNKLKKKFECDGNGGIKLIAPIFRRVRKIARSELQLRHVRPSVRLHGKIQLKMDGFS